ncbi:MAG TPA: hypothetical protein VF101_01200, partial [Gaiellaceae bacterium]
MSRVTVTGEPLDAIIVGGRANGDGYAGRVTISRCTLLGGTRNVVSATSVIGLTISRSRIAGASGGPGAGIDLEPGGRGSPALDVRFERNRISGDAGPGILLAFSTNAGRLVYGTDVTIARNQIVGNGTSAAAPQRGGIVFNGGQDRGGG